MKEAVLWHKEDDKIRCDLCGRRCLIPQGGLGACLVRKNVNGKLYSLNYGKLIALHVDPIEKKPLFHFLPGESTFSIASAGCNFACRFCFEPTTMVLTNKGVLSFEELFDEGEVMNFGDGFVSFPDGYFALTHNGNPSRISKVYKHPYSGEMIVINPYCLPKLEVTPSHRFFIYEENERKIKKIRADEVRQDHLLTLPKFSTNASKKYKVLDIKKMISEYYMRHGGSGLEELRLIEGDAHYFVRIESLEKRDYSGFVYNLEVEDRSHSYLANFVSVANCCNYDISQVYRDRKLEQILGEDYTPEDVVNQAASEGCRIISYTYTEPTIFFEFAYDTAKLAHRRGIKNTFVTNGYMTPDAVKMIASYLDAATVDFKCSGDPECYRKIIGIPDVNPIYDCLMEMKRQKIFVEITNLVIPSFDDDMSGFRKLVGWIRDNLGDEIPFHILRFFPTYSLLGLPDTPLESLRRAYEIAKREGMKFVYLGNVPGQGENTYCPTCGELLIERFGLMMSRNRLRGDRCPKCGTRIPLII